MASAREIAEFLGLACELDVEIRSVSGVENASPASMCFAADEATLAAALGSQAGLILGPLGSASGDARVLAVKQPRVAFALVYRQFFQQEQAAGVHPVRIHTTAVVGEDVKIGEGSSIGPRVVIGDGVTIGRDCRLLAGVTIYPGTVLGDRVAAQAGAVLGSTGFGYVRVPETGEYVAFPQLGRLVIEDDVEIGANTTIDRGALGETRIGRGTKIDNLVHIGHNCRIGEDVVIAAQTGLSGSTVIGNGAVIGGQVGIGDHATIGPGVILGSGSGVLTGKKLNGPGQVFWGIPAQPLKDYLRDLARFRKG
jgi:UDP-3-O-[3-hydroxymyristoyl] glucosamine N-acyltransferase